MALTNEIEAQTASRGAFVMRYRENHRQGTAAERIFLLRVKAETGRILSEHVVLSKY